MKISTLAAFGALSVASAFGAQAQTVTVDGILNANEIGAASAGKYVVLGTYPYAHGFGDAGLLSLYAANSATKIYLFLGGTLQPYKDGNGNNSFQIYLSVPGLTGVPTGTALPSPMSGATSFGKMNGKLDQAAQLGIAIHTNGTTGQYQVEGVSYTSATAATDQVLTAAASPVVDTGAPITLATSGAFAPFNGARVSYRNTMDGKIQSNPGYAAPGTAGAVYGAAGTYGLEIEIDRTALGILVGTPVLNLFALQNNGGGDYASSDYIPNAVAPAAPNLTKNPDFTTIAGTQSAMFTLATALATKTADEAAVALSVFPNPATGRAVVAYRVLGKAAAVRIVLTDLLGRQVRVLESNTKPVGLQSTVLDAGTVTAGIYLVRAQVGEQAAVRKLVVE